MSSSTSHTAWSENDQLILLRCFAANEPHKKKGIGENWKKIHQLLQNEPDFTKKNISAEALKRECERILKSTHTFVSHELKTVVNDLRELPELLPSKPTQKELNDIEDKHLNEERKGKEQKIKGKRSGAVAEIPEDPTEYIFELCKSMKESEEIQKKLNEKQLELTELKIKKLQSSKNKKRKSNYYLLTL